MYKSNLKIGDSISLQSLSSGMAGDERFNHRYIIGKKRLEDLGFKTIDGEHSLKGIEYISDNPEARAKDLMASMKSDVSLVISNIGGEDSHTIIPFLVAKDIVDNPTPILGYSDTTSLHLYFYTLGIQTYYGPSVLSGFAENVKMHELTKKSFLDVLVDGKEQILTSSPEWTSEMLDWGNQEFNSVARKMEKEEYGHIWENFSSNIEGKLIGGCLDSIAENKDQDFFPELKFWKDTVIFLETSEEKMSPSVFKESLLSIFEEIKSSKAILFGKPKDETYLMEYKEIFLELFDKPVIFNMNFGHTAPMYTLPYGGNVTISIDDKKICIKK